MHILLGIMLLTTGMVYPGAYDLTAGPVDHDAVFSELRSQPTSLPTAPAEPLRSAGLRPGEIEMLKAIEQREMQELERALARQAERERLRLREAARRRAACAYYRARAASIDSDYKRRVARRTVDRRFRTRRFWRFQRQKFRNGIAQYCD